MNFAKFLRTPVLTEHIRWMLLILLNDRQITKQKIAMAMLISKKYIHMHRAKCDMAKMIKAISLESSKVVFPHKQFSCNIVPKIATYM